VYYHYMYMAAPVRLLLIKKYDDDDLILSYLA